MMQKIDHCTIYSTIITVVCVLGAIYVTVTAGQIPESLLILIIAVLTGQVGTIAINRINGNTNQQNDQQGKEQ